MMVYMGNILKAHENLEKNESILLHFGKDSSVCLHKEDKIEKHNGDLKITRLVPKKQIVYVDTAFIKFAVICER